MQHLAGAKGAGGLSAWYAGALVFMSVSDNNTEGKCRTRCLLPEEFLHFTFLGVVGDLVGDTSASASSLWIWSLSVSSLTEISRKFMKSWIEKRTLQRFLCEGYALFGILDSDWSISIRSRLFLVLKKILNILKLIYMVGSQRQHTHT